MDASDNCYPEPAMQAAGRRDQREKFGGFRIWPKTFGDFALWEAHFPDIFE